MDGRARFLVERGFLADPVIDIPVQRAVVIQESLQKAKGEKSWDPQPMKTHRCC